MAQNRHHNQDYHDQDQQSLCESHGCKLNVPVEVLVCGKNADFNCKIHRFCTDAHTDLTAFACIPPTLHDLLGRYFLRLEAGQSVGIHSLRGKACYRCSIKGGPAAEANDPIRRVCVWVVFRQPCRRFSKSDVEPRTCITDWKVHCIYSYHWGCTVERESAFMR